MLRDYDIRESLRDKLISEYKGTNTIIVDELPICWGDARIDIAVVNCSLHGYEIKSDRDTLERLPNQIEMYNKIFDTVTLVCSPKLVAKAQALIPDWWEIILPISDESEPSGVRFETDRLGKENPAVDIRSLIELTWKEEAISILAERGLARGYRSKPRWDIWDRIVEAIPTEEIKCCVRECLKARAGQGWRSPDSLQKLCAD